VHVQVQQRHAVHDRPRHLADVVALGRLDLDHLRAEIGEVRGDRAGTEQRALDHAQAGERGTGCDIRYLFVMSGPERAESLPTLQATARTPTLARDAPGIPHAQELAAAVGKSLGASDWLVVDQQRIDRFADATDDHQWIHVDVARARTGPFASTIAHGYLTLSLVNALLPQLISVPTPCSR
jgi:hypothetical protein